MHNGKRYGAGCDGVNAKNVCGYSNIHLDNIYITRIKPHFHCALNISNFPLIQLALQAIEGLEITSLSKEGKERAAKAIECGYLYRDENMLYTKILVSRISDMDKMFAISNELQFGYFDADAEVVAAKIAELITESIADYLLGEWRFANRLASAPILDAVVECLIEKGV